MFQKHFEPNQFVIQCFGIKYRGRRVPKKNAMPTIFPQKSNDPEDIQKFNEAGYVREKIESIQHDHAYLGEKKNPWKDEIKQSRKIDVSKANQEYFKTPPMNEIEVETTEQIVHNKNLEIKRLQKLLNERIEHIEKIEKENQILKDEKNALLPKELFNTIFGEDQIKCLQKGKFSRNISDETIKKGLKLRFACGTRGKTCDHFFKIESF